MPVIYDWHERENEIQYEKVRMQVRGIRKNHDTLSRLFVRISRQDGDELVIRFIVAFLQDYNGEKVFGIEVVSHPEKMRSVDAIVLK